MIALVFFGGINNELQAAGAPLQAGTQAAKGPKIWLQDNQAVPVTHVGPATAAQALAAGQGQPLSMTTGDFDGDGIADLLVGYNTAAGSVVTLQRGNLDAFAPQSDASFQAIGRGQFPQPYLTRAQVISVPVSPDFLAAGNFTGKGNLDFVLASKDGNALYLFAGDGKGGFASPQIISLNGGVTAMAAGDFGNAAHSETLMVGTSAQSPAGFMMSVYHGTTQGLVSLASYALTAAVSNINFGDFGDSGLDAAFLSGGQVQILRSSTMELESVSLPVSASALVLGSFLPDRTNGMQMALLTSDGAIQIVAHSEFDPRIPSADELQAIKQAAPRGRSNPLIPARVFPVNGWKIVESVPSVAPFGGQAPIVFKTRISSNGADDVMVLNGAMGQMAVVSHPDVKPGDTTFTPAQVSIRPYAGSPVAALPQPAITSATSTSAPPAVCVRR